MIPRSVDYLEMFQQSVRNAAAQIPTDDTYTNWEDLLQSCAASATQSCLRGSQRHAQYIFFCFNEIIFQTVLTFSIAIDDLAHIAQSSNERRKQMKNWSCNDKDLYHQILTVDSLRSMVYFLRKIEMRSGDLDKDTQVKDADEKLEMNGEKSMIGM